MKAKSIFQCNRPFSFEVMLNQTGKLFFCATQYMF